MQGSKLISFQLHSYNQHKFYIDENNKKHPAYITVRKGETKEQYLQRIDNDVAMGVKYLKNMGINPVAMAYPFGRVNQSLITALEDNGIKLGYVGFDNSLDSVNTDVYHLQRYNVSQKIDTPEKLLKMIKYNFEDNKAL